MSLVEKIKDFFNNEITLSRLFKVVAILLIIFLITQTWPTWQSTFRYLVQILKPFLIGFTIAYVVHPLVAWLEKKHIKKGIAIGLIFLLGILLFAFIIINLFPMFYEEAGAFFTSITSSVDTLFSWYKDNASNPSELLDGIIKQINQSFAGLQKGFFDFFGVFITNLISGSINVVTTGLFSLTVAIYALADYDKVKASVKRGSSLVHKDLPIYLAGIDKSLGTYVRSTLVLMMIYFTEYTLVFYLLGHKGYLMIGLLYVLATLVPYIGGMIVTGIGILTGLTMPRTNLIALIVIIGLMSQLDSYFISPFVYKKGVKIEPLWSLLVIFIGSALFGPVGIMISVPTYLSIREVIRIYKQRHNLEVKEISNEKDL